LRHCMADFCIRCRSSVWRSDGKIFTPALLNMQMNPYLIICMAEFFFRTTSSTVTPGVFTATIRRYNPGPPREGLKIPKPSSDPWA
jgi:hypothetical protein